MRQLEHGTHLKLVVNWTTMRRVNLTVALRRESALILVENVNNLMYRGN